MSRLQPRRDLWLLPLISMVTAIVMLGGAELLSRAFWPEHVVNSCRMPDPVLGFRYRPNCEAETKTAEGPWIKNDYNECGYRSAASCGAAPAGTLRVAVIGASLSEGHMVPYGDTIATRVGVDLATLCRSPVDVQNLAAIGYSAKPLLLNRMDEALKLKPQVVLLMLAPFDVEGERAGDAIPAGAPPAPAGGIQHRVFEALKSSRAVLVFQHFLFRNPSIYVPLYLRYGDRADFLRPPFTPAWQARLRVVDQLVADLTDRARSAGALFMLAFIPQEAQVALMAHGDVPKGVDPEALPEALKAIVERHGALYADTSVPLRTHQNPERLYYQVDGHLSGLGQPLAAAYIARRLATAPNSPFARCGGQLSAELGSKS